MPDIHFECPKCNQTLDAPEELASQLIDCPTCKATIEVPIRTRPQKPPPAHNSLPQPVRRHSIFYYVFCGTVSLFATLAILLFCFFFLTATGAGLLAALTHRNSTEQTSTRAAHAVRNLPALTEDETETASSLMGRLAASRDDIEGITWYRSPAGADYKTSVYLSIGKEDGKKPWLRWHIQYYGDDWLFIRDYRIKIEQQDAITLRPTAKIDHAISKSGGSVWERFVEDAEKHAHLLNQILASKSVKLRMSGTKGVNDIELSPDHLQQMRDVLLVYRHMGGVWPAD